MSRSSARACPIVVQPVLEAKPWGSDRLAECGLALPAGAMIGEAHFTSPDAIVVSGEHAGSTLGSIASAAPGAWIGSRGLAVTGGQPIFPLLVKLIDANADLSIQVHPDDAAAAAAGLGTGKTEAWHIVSAAPGSRLYLGLDPAASADDFARACASADGSSSRYLRQAPAEAGVTFVVPAGTPHAIGAGVLIYEIQQPSNVTFRLDDWGRAGEDGQPRTLHLGEGLAVLDAESRPEPIIPIAIRATSPRREILAATRYFALERLTFEPRGRAALPATQSPQVLTSLNGVAALSGDGWREPLAPGRAIVIPVGYAAALSASQDAVVLRGWTPDLAREVVAPARAAGAADREIARLGIEVGG